MKLALLNIFVLVFIEKMHCQRTDFNQCDSQDNVRNLIQEVEKMRFEFQQINKILSGIADSMMNQNSIRTAMTRSTSPGQDTTVANSDKTTTEQTTAKAATTTHVATTTVQLLPVPISSGCNTSEWQCENNKCISVSFVCNARDNCGDSSDEKIELCRMYDWPACREFKFLSFTIHRCTSTYGCYKSYFRCNGYNNCPDGSDEDDCP